LIPDWGRGIVSQPVRVLRKFAPMWRLFALVLLRRVSTEECPNVPFTDRNATGSYVPRLPRATPVLADIVGLSEAKEVLREAVVLPSKMAVSETRLFWRSGERSAVLLVGPSGLGKAAAAEAAAAAAGALVLSLPASEVASSSFCRTALAAAASKPIVVIVEALDSAPRSASLAIQQCLRQAAASDETVVRLFIVATMSHEVGSVSATALVPFGYVVKLGLPSESERKQFLQRLLTQISRIDPQWGSSLREESLSTLANLTAKHTFGEMELLIRRAFVRSMNDEGTRDPVALHHFEQILAGMPPQAAEAFSEAHVAEPATSSAEAGEGQKAPSTTKDDGKKKDKKDAKDPMDGIFGWCNFWLPEALHLPPVVWAMIIFGILAHFMARSTYQPYGHRKRRGAGGPGGGSSLFGELGARGGMGGMGGGGGGGEYPSFGDNMSDWQSGAGSLFGNFPPPPGMGRMDGPPSGPGSAAAGLGGQEGGSSERPASRADLPTAGEPTVASPPDKTN